MRETTRYELVLGIAVTSIVIAVIGWYHTASNGLLSEAVHEFGDSMPFVLGWIIAKDWVRKDLGEESVEFVIKLLNIIILMGGGIWFAYLGICRFYYPVVVEPAMLWFAPVGLVANGGQLFFAHGLKDAHEHGSTSHSQLLHLGADWFGSIAVVVAAVVIYINGYAPADSIASFVVAAISLWAGGKCCIEFYTGKLPHNHGHEHPSYFD